MIKVYYNEPEEETEVNEEDLKDVPQEALDMLSDNKGED